MNSNAIQIEIPARFFAYKFRDRFLNLYVNKKDLENRKKKFLRQKTRAGGFILLEFETYHTATVTGTTLLVQGLINQSNRRGCKYRPTHKR